MWAPGYVYAESMLGGSPSFVWYCIPRNASRSLLKMLGRRGGRRIADAAPGAQPVAWLGQQNRPDFAFGFARRPGERLASYWRGKLQRRQPHAAPLVFERMPGLEFGMSLEQFVDWLDANRPLVGQDKHLRP